MTLTRTRVALPGRYASGTSSASTISIVSGSAPAATARALASSRARAIASARDVPSRLWTWSTSPLTWPIAAPIAFATWKWSGRITAEAPASAPSTRMLPPPTSTTDTSAALIFT